MKLLLIDDQINVISSLKEAIEPAGHECVLCEKPDQAVLQFRQGHFDVVITDYRMPEMNGIDVLKAVQNIRPGTPVVLLTGHADVNNAIDALNNGAYAFFQKPVQFQHFLETIHRIDELVQKKKNKNLQMDHMVEEREALKREVHHRVRNNLQIVRSLLKLHARNIENSEAMDVVTKVYDRIFAMSLVHDRVFQYNNFEKVDFAIYAHELASVLLKSHDPKESHISITTRMDSVFINLETAIPCGLVLNELVMNSLKHAFPDGRKGGVWVTLKPLPNEELALIVGDDGVGLPEAFDFQTVQSMGLYLVRLLAESQLDGVVRIRRNPGTEFEIVFTEKMYCHKMKPPVNG